MLFSIHYYHSFFNVFCPDIKNYLNRVFCWHREIFVLYPLLAWRIVCTVFSTSIALWNVWLYFLSILKVGSTRFSANIKNYLHCGLSIFFAFVCNNIIFIYYIHFLSITDVVLIFVCYFVYLLWVFTVFFDNIIVVFFTSTTENIFPWRLCWINYRKSWILTQSLQDRPWLGINYFCVMSLFCSGKCFVNVSENSVFQWC